jgi:predicted DNA binding CopG/RHH family protein
MTRKKTKPRKKVRVTTLIDSDVLAEIKATADRLRVPYQTLINAILGVCIEGSHETKTKK